MTFPAVEGIVRVVSVVGVRNCVAVPRIAAAGIHRSIIPSMTDRASAVKTRHLPKYSPAAAADRWQFPDTDYKGGKSVVH